MHALQSTLSWERDCWSPPTRRASPTSLPREAIGWREVALPVTYRSLRITTGYRIDMLIEGEVIIESKAVQTLHPIHEAQLLTYLKLSGHDLGFLVNWNVTRIRDGIKRMIYYHQHYRPQIPQP